MDAYLHWLLWNFWPIVVSRLADIAERKKGFMTSNGWPPLYTSPSSEKIQTKAYDRQCHAHVPTSTSMVVVLEGTHPRYRSVLGNTISVSRP